MVQKAVSVTTIVTPEGETTQIKNGSTTVSEENNMAKPKNNVKKEIKKREKSLVPYYKTEKGKAAAKKYRNSKKGKEAAEKYKKKHAKK